MQYIGFDIHKRYTFFTQMNEVGAIQRQGRLPNTREAMGAFFSDVVEPAQVVMEAGPTWYYIYDLLETLLGKKLPRESSLPSGWCGRKGSLSKQSR